MPSYTRGKIRFESTFTKKEEGRVSNMFELSCIPPPTGSETNFNYSATVRPFVLQRFLQPHEIAALVEGALLPGETGLTPDTLIDGLASPLSFKPLDIDTTKVPAEWRQNVDCYKVTVGYVAVYHVYDIKAVTTEDLKVGDVEYPKDDTVASFRIYTPVEYRFIRYYTWNPECCPNKEPVPKAWDITPFYSFSERKEYKIPLNPKRWELDPWKFPWKWPDFPNYPYEREKG